MKFELKLLRTRVARRMLLLFLACAVVPVVVLGGVAYWFVAHSLAAAERSQLHQDGNVAGQLMMGRLQELAAELKPGQGATTVSPAPDTTDIGSASFTAVALEHESGGLTVIDGKMPPLPLLDPSQLAQLGIGRPALVVTSGDGPRELYLVVPSVDAGQNGYPRRWGYVTVDGAMSGLEAVRVGTQFCLRDEAGPLFCDAGPASTDLAGQFRRGAPNVEENGTASHTIFLKYEFAARSGQVVIRARGTDAGSADRVPAGVRARPALRRRFGFHRQSRADPPANDTARRSRGGNATFARRRFLHARDGGVG